MTSVGTGTTGTASSLVGCRGVALFGTKNPSWYPCVVHTDNLDGTLKVQWEDGKKYTKRLPEENFKLTVDETKDEPVQEDVDVPQDIFAKFGEGDY